VECTNTENDLKFRQIFRNNMSQHDEPTITSLTAADKKKGDYVMISFSPDLARFKMDTLDSDAVGLISKRAYDVAGSMAHCGGKKLVVTLNGERLQVKTFKEYIGMFDGINAPVAFEQVLGRWEVGVSASEDSSMRHVSFVNAISTSKGGSHVNYIADQIAEYVKHHRKKKVCLLVTMIPHFSLLVL
jgi:DNA topoisomerase II